MISLANGRIKKFFWLQSSDIPEFLPFFSLKCNGKKYYTKTLLPKIIGLYVIVINGKIFVEQKFYPIVE